MNKLRWIYERLSANLDEAENYAGKAMYYRAHGDKQAADWCISMAQAHIQFNANGMALLDKALGEIEDAHLAPGVKAVYDELKYDINQRGIKARMLIDAAAK